jgi:hypothetical protein
MQLTPGNAEAKAFTGKWYQLTAKDSGRIHVDGKSGSKVGGNVEVTMSHGCTGVSLDLLYVWLHRRVTFSRCRGRATGQPNLGFF